MTGENTSSVVDATAADGEGFPIADSDPEPIAPMDESRTVARQHELRQTNTFPHHLGSAILSGAEIQLPLF